MFGRVTALHFVVFLPSLGEVAPLTCTVNVNADGDLEPVEVYRQGSGDEVPKEERVRALEHAADACAMVQDGAVSAADPVACALRAVVDAERDLYRRAQEAAEAARFAGLGCIGWDLGQHKNPDYEAHHSTPGVRALEEYVSHLAEAVVPKAMLQKAEEAQEREAEERLLCAAEDLNHDMAECRAELRQERLERMGRP